MNRFASNNNSKNGRGNFKGILITRPNGYKKKNMGNDKITLTADQAIALLPKGKMIHTFRGGGAMIIGADWDRASLIEAIKSNEPTLEIGGINCRSMGHGLILNDGTNLFIATDEEKLNAFDPIEVKTI